MSDIREDNMLIAITDHFWGKGYKSKSKCYTFTRKTSLTILAVDFL